MSGFKRLDRSLPGGEAVRRKASGMAITATVPEPRQLSELRAFGASSNRCVDGNPIVLRFKSETPTFPAAFTHSSGKRPASGMCPRLPPGSRP
jgi:hypothetical protein